MGKPYIISVCIPSYNRPDELKRLLDSFYTSRVEDVQVVICEDKAPKRLLVRKVVEDFVNRVPYHVKYIENEENLGHGGNLRQCIRQADGEFVMYMGDDDMFTPHGFDKFLVFVENNRSCGYILRSYRVLLKDGTYEYCRYYDSDKHFPSGVQSYVSHFAKSVSMSGFTIKRDYVIDYDIDCLDKTLLFQLYLLAEVCLKYPSAYCNTPCADLVSDGVSFFGNNKKEVDLYTPEVKVINNINFIKGYFVVSEYVDRLHNLDSTPRIKKDLSKYSYYILAAPRRLGFKKFNAQVNELRSIGLDSSIYFNIYYVGLLLFGDRFCRRIIHIIKSILGRRMHL